MLHARAVADRAAEGPAVLRPGERRLIGDRRHAIRGPVRPPKRRERLRCAPCVPSFLSREGKGARTSGFMRVWISRSQSKCRSSRVAIFLFMM